MIFGVSPTKEAVVIARTVGSGEAFVIKSIMSIPFQARSGADLPETAAASLRTYFGPDQRQLKPRSQVALGK